MTGIATRGLLTLGLVLGPECLGDLVGRGFLFGR